MTGTGRLLLPFCYLLVLKVEWVGFRIEKGEAAFLCISYVNMGHVTRGEDLVQSFNCEIVVAAQSGIWRYPLGFASLSKRWPIPILAFWSPSLASRGSLWSLLWGNRWARPTKRSTRAQLGGDAASVATRSCGERGPEVKAPCRTCRTIGARSDHLDPGPAPRLAELSMSRKTSDLSS